MDKDRKVICKIISKMLDSPGPCDIYPTGKAYDELEAYVDEVRKETVGWVHDEACLKLDQGLDIRRISPWELLIRAQDNLSK